MADSSSDALLDEGDAVKFDQDLQAMLLQAVRGGSKITDAHLMVVEKDVVVGDPPPIAQPVSV